MRGIDGGGMVGFSSAAVCPRLCMAYSSAFLDCSREEAGFRMAACSATSTEALISLIILDEPNEAIGRHRLSRGLERTW